MRRRSADQAVPEPIMTLPNDERLLFRRATSTLRKRPTAVCFALYLASDRVLPVWPWNKDARGFYAEHADRHHLRNPALSKPYVYYLGSHLGCGCGFLTDGSVAGTPEDEEIRQTHVQLADYLALAARDGPAELLMTWEGEEGHLPQRAGTIHPHDVRVGNVRFREGRLYIVSRDIEA